ncbi:acetyl esterase [Nakamurella sp. UYEF19]|uniref:alpha/beta hydrolase n=1 Tax=Nakamurella sp. UYEF19 TaxID=1756392 RepID=UPI003392F91E
MDHMDDELTTLVASVAARLPAPARWPSAVPRPGQTDAQWRQATARIRSEHDAAAIRGSRLIREGGEDIPVGSISYQDIPVADGAVTGRIYRPATAAGPLPALVVLHGGAWWMGGGAAGFDLNDGLCRALCAGIGAVIVNLDYRLAPEHRFPTQLDDAYAALCWTADPASGLGVDPGRLGILGISSGGNVAAAAVLMARDRGGPALRAQVLVSPSLDCTIGSKSMQEDPALLAGAMLLRQLYTQGQSDLTLPYLSPVLAADLTDLPASLISVGDFDPLRDDGLRYGRRLAEAGVPTTVNRYPMTHTVSLPAVHRQWLADTIAGTRELLLVPATESSDA